MVAVAVIVVVHRGGNYSVRVVEGMYKALKCWCPLFC